MESDNDFEKLEQKQIELKRKLENLEDEDMSSIYTKILFNYMQIVSVIGSFEFDWPNSVTSL